MRFPLMSKAGNFVSIVSVLGAFCFSRIADGRRSLGLGCDRRRPILPVDERQTPVGRPVAPLRYDLHGEGHLPAAGKLALALAGHQAL